MMQFLQLSGFSFEIKITLGTRWCAPPLPIALLNLRADQEPRHTKSELASRRFPVTPGGQATRHPPQPEATERPLLLSILSFR